MDVVWLLVYLKLIMVFIATLSAVQGELSGYKKLFKLNNFIKIIINYNLWLELKVLMVNC